MEIYPSTEPQFKLVYYLAIMLGPPIFAVLALDHWIVSVAAIAWVTLFALGWLWDAFLGPWWFPQFKLTNEEEMQARFQEWIAGQTSKDRENLSKFANRLLEVESRLEAEQKLNSRQREQIAQLMEKKVVE